MRTKDITSRLKTADYFAQQEEAENDIPNKPEITGWSSEASGLFIDLYSVLIKEGRDDLAKLVKEIQRNYI